MTIALKRHHRQRIKRNRRYHFGRDLSGKIAHSQVIDTPTPCSCWMCGNERRYFKKLTLQELRSLDYFRAE